MGDVLFPQEPIAVVGSACRLAGGSNSPSKLWELLRQPRDVRVEIPNDRFNTKGYYHPNGNFHGHMNVRHSYLLEEDPRVFDAEFFGINPIEASAMDPQQRLLLETVYEAVEAAGMTIEGLKDSDTAIYAGLMCGDYDALLLRDPDRLPTYTAVGTSRAVLSNRVSYFFDWHGPSMTMDTACSSSLVAVHHAIQTLRAGDSRVAVACGSNLILGPEMYIIESKLKMLSPDGLGRMWDKEANGYARGEGVAAVMLKKLSQALEDGDDIECIIRETGVNQDGATGGLTMPSATAQRALIQSVYSKAGLDPRNPAHRPQYIEAHGTGTPAGDPVEAQALRSAFFCEGEDSHTNPVYTGSVKTVLGHTEGTAGIAGLLKASEAMRNSIIPPNLLFNELAASVAPFYGNLQIPTTAKPWPKTVNQQPKRASVNNFGFGGTNAHAIVESYDPQIRRKIESGTQLTPVVFSAASEEALRANLAAYAEYLIAHPKIDIRDLAYTLRERRSVFAHRVTFAGETVKQLVANISATLESEAPISTRAWRRTGDSCRILGVFTGQGAQYACMGAGLLEKSPMARNIIRSLEKHLAALGQDSPSWSLEAELLADSSKSRVSEAAVSQPLCTAVQIMMVDILAAANVRFDAVVGHSSGEIAAAYAAGYLSARDALLIAYYRGLHCKHALSPNGATIKGAMLAVGTSLEDAISLCESEELTGRVKVAACNSSSSISISGDEDAIEELALALDDEKKFNRRLRVDQAYHSRHMLPCTDPYIASLNQADVKVQKDRGSGSKCVWYSSVHNGKPVDEGGLQLSNVYWAQNMTQPVMFAQAILSALAGVGEEKDAPFEAVIEVGAHPSLAGPASQSIQEALHTKLPYFGTLKRTIDATEAFAACLGALWTYLDPAAHIPSLERCEVALAGLNGGQKYFNVLKGLPTYQWKHETRYWAESRRSRKLRLRERAFHPLLGDVSPDSAPHLMRWKNILKPIEMPWIQCHQVQNQIVLPAAAYVSSAIEAAQFLVADDMKTTIELIELSNFHIHNAIMFDTDDTGVEVQIELGHVSRARPNCITANFVYSAALGGDNAELDLAAQGEVRILLGTPSPDILPRRQPKPPHVIPVDSDRLYDFMASLEYDFRGPFKSLTTLERKLGKASCIAKKARTSPAVPDDADSLLVHPIDLDAAFQSVMLAYSYPGDDQLRLLHLPTSIAKVRVNPATLRTDEFLLDDFTAVDSICSASDRDSPSSGFSGSVSMYAAKAEGTPAAVQVDQVEFRPVGSDASNDRNVFYNMHWVLACPDGPLAANQVPITPRDKELMFVLARVAAFYLRLFDEAVPEDSPIRRQSPECHYLNYARHMTNLLRHGKQKWANKDWINDTLQDVQNDIEAKGFIDSSDVQIMLLVGKTMPKVFNGETTMLQPFRESGLLDQYYANGFGTKQTTIWVASVLKQLTDRNPHLSLLEIGAGTGGATQSILNTIGQDFDEYTFTDISSSFFENAANKFSNWENRMKFKVCNAEIDPVQQGFEVGTHDVVIAFMVVHACAVLDEAMANLRKLLKPGGKLILGEGAADGAMQAGAGFIFGPLSGWWRGVDEGRTLSPLVNVSEWELILKRTGFSGIDTMSPPKLFDAFGITLFVSTAVDARINFAIDPLAAVGIAEAHTVFQHVVILGGQTAPVAAIARDVKEVLSPLATKVSTFRMLEEMPEDVLDAETKIISLIDLERPVFQDITSERWDKFRKIFESEKTVLWLTRARLEDDPYCNMTVGFGRSAMHEEDTLRVQYVDVPAVEKVDARDLVQRLLRFDAQALDDRDILYTKEPETLMDAEGRERVPRLFPVADANDRLNSATRLIFRPKDLTKSVVELEQLGDGGSHLRELTRYETDEGLTPESVEPDTIRLKVTHAVKSALSTPIGHLFLVLGHDNCTGSRYVALASSLRSLLRIPKQSALAIEGTKLSGMAAQTILTLATAEIVALAVVNFLFPGQRLILHNAPEVIAAAVERQALTKRVFAVFLADDRPGQNPESWVKTVKLPSYLGVSECAETVPTGADCFVGLSTGLSENQSTILSILPRCCRIETVRTLFASAGRNINSNVNEFLSQFLKTVLDGIVSSATPDQKAAIATPMVKLETVVQGDAVEDPLTIIEWSTASSTLPARVTRIESQRLFKCDKTYWLVGLSGALGISLCDWMIKRGVKYLVLTSRNPKVDARWIEEHAHGGVTIQILCCDVTNEEAIKAVHRNIVGSLPPIVGLLNGAMVLRDVSVRNMDFEHVTDVIRPKVLGSIHLDRIFHDVDLDFFVLLSSINCVIGNVGQANYAAANMGMIGVAGSRRKRGLRSSVVNVGAVIGVGYITQSDRQLDVTVAKTAMMHLSEQDFHQIFAECMEAGHLDNPVGPEISTGLLGIVPQSINIPPWYSDPKFARFIITQPAGDSGKKERSGSISTLERLETCTTAQEILNVIRESFGAQLRRVLQVSVSDDDLMRMRGIELGFDSLISVDIRSWFLKNFKVSIPVLKIMASDVQMFALVELALEGIPAEMTPQLVAQSSPAAMSLKKSSETRRDRSVSPVSSGTSASDVSTPPSSAALSPMEDMAGGGVMKSVSVGVVVDWDAETSPPSAAAFPCLPKGVALAKQRPEVIVLTGCSGLLGHHLLNSLVVQPGIRKVICLATRRLSDRVANQEIPAPSSRIVYFEGDLSAERFGLTPTEWVTVFAEADAVIHNGSDTSHLKYYSALRQANVESTKQLVCACVPRQVPLHYISSAGVALFAELDEFPEISCTKTGKKPPADGSHGYMCGKWVCESMLERVHKMYPDQRIVIQRPSTIIREGDDAEVSKAGFDWVNALLHYCHKTKTVPKVDHNSGSFDFVSVQTCCDDILRELLSGTAASRAKAVVYVNNVGDVVIPMNHMADMGKARGDRAYNIVSMQEWTRIVVEAGMHPAVAALIELFDEPGAEQYPKLLRAKA